MIQNNNIMNIVFTDTEQSIQRRLKRYSGKLAAAGSGVILFGVWSIVKVVLFNSINKISDISYFLEGLEDKKIIAIALYAIVGIELIIRLYIGRSARLEAFGKKQTTLYLVVSCIMFITSAVSTVCVLLSTLHANDIGSFLITIILEGTSSFVYGALIYYSIRTKQMKKYLRVE